MIDHHGMASIHIDVPENAGLLTDGGELFHHDTKQKAEIRFKAVTAAELVPGYRDCSDNEQMIQIEHIVTDTKGRRFMFASFVSPYFFWDQMFLAKIVGCSPEYIEYGNLLDGYPHQRKMLIENVYFYSDGRKRRALRCSFPPTPEDPDDWSERIFPIIEKHLGVRLSIIGVEWEKDLAPNLIVEFHDFGQWRDIKSGKKHGGDQTGKLCFRLSPHHALWRHFEKPVVQKYGEPGPKSFDGVSFGLVSPLIPITFRELKQNE
jgi:hypothetical protein